MKSDSDSKKVHSTADERDRSKKRDYQSPELVEYGSLKDLTQFGGSNAADFFGMMFGGGGGGMMGMGMN